MQIFGLLQYNVLKSVKYQDYFQTLSSDVLKTNIIYTSILKEIRSSKTIVWYVADDKKLFEKFCYRFSIPRYFLWKYPTETPSKSGHREIYDPVGMNSQHHAREIQKKEPKLIYCIIYASDVIEDIIPKY